MFSFPPPILSYILLAAAVCFVNSYREKKRLLKNSQGVCNGMRGDHGSCVDSPFSVLIGGFLNFVHCDFYL